MDEGCAVSPLLGLLTGKRERVTDMKKMTCKGFEIRELANGKYRCSVPKWKGSDEKYVQDCKDFCEAGEFVWNLADNHDISHVVCEKMCDVFGKTFGEVL